FIALTLLMVAATAYVTLQSAEDDANKLATRLHVEISDNINLQLDEHLAHAPNDIAGISSLLHRLPVARDGHALVVDRTGKTVASTAGADNPIAVQAIAAMAGATPEQLNDGAQFRFDNITTKPLARTTWLARATAYQDRQGGHDDWIVLTVMP